MEKVSFSDFVLTCTKGSNCLDWEYFAEVSVTIETGMLWWKRKTITRRKVSRTYAGHWFFVDTGEYTPGNEIAVLERSYKAQDTLRSQCLTVKPVR